MAPAPAWSGLAFDCQRVDALPARAHDVPLALVRNRRPPTLPIHVSIPPPRDRMNYWLLKSEPRPSPSTPSRRAPARPPAGTGCATTRRATCCATTQEGRPRLLLSFLLPGAGHRRHRRDRARRLSGCDRAWNHAASTTMRKALKTSRFGIRSMCTSYGATKQLHQPRVTARACRGQARRTCACCVKATGFRSRRSMRRTGISSSRWSEAGLAPHRDTNDVAYTLACNL